MTDEIPYKDGNALWAAVTAPAKTEAQASGVAAGALLRRFVVDRFLASIAAYCGVKRRDHFSVDVVTGDQMTAKPDVQTRPGLVPAVPPTSVRLYPVVDHIADKLCATQSSYGTAGDQPSSRVRDLIDLVVFARTQQIDGTELIKAITSEWTHRGLPGTPYFAPPANWDRLYPAEARRVPACGDTITLAAATELVAELLGPVFDRTATDKQWEPSSRSWAQS